MISGSSPSIFYSSLLCSVFQFEPKIHAEPVISTLSTALIYHEYSDVLIMIITIKSSPMETLLSFSLP
jgi:hypothetical protein